MRKLKYFVMVLLIISCSHNFKSKPRPEIRTREIDGVLVSKQKFKPYLNKSSMQLNSEESINVNLNWDYSGNKRETGTYNEEYEFTTETHSYHFKLYINIEIENDDGDYWSPPTFDVIDEVVDVSELKVFDIMDNPVLLEEELLNKLALELEKLVNYE